MIRKNEKSYLWRGILSAEWSGQTIGPLDQTLVKHIGQDTCLAFKASQNNKFIILEYQYNIRKESSFSYQQAGHGLDRQAAGTQKPVSPNGQVGESVVD
jgi:hypothetical protein